MVGLREATNNERILALKSLLKESNSFLQENICFDSCKNLALLHFSQNLENISFEIKNCCLDQNSTEVAAVASGYIAKKMIKRTYCLEALTQPATGLTQYVSKSFTVLDLCEYIVRKSDPHERVAAENVMKFNDLPQ